ncbi:hypothetical protein NX059_008212 [Plenodomus lindquistii]|nr:hypothetical protein NX059_008212 [Plenodomus lindquistii]
MMDGVGAGGLVLGVLPVLIFVLDSYYSHASIRHNHATYHTRVKEYGWLVTWIQYAFFADAFTIMDRVECQIRHASDEQVVAFIRSQAASFNMIGVAGAIIAQVAVSAMSLTKIGTSHWTIQAFFIASLVTGCLSVFFSCSISLAINGLHDAPDIKDFLFMSTTAEIHADIAQIPTPYTEAGLAELARLVEEGKWTVASSPAATMLVVPRTLLNIALNSFLIGLGIFLGMLGHAELKDAYGDWIGVLAFYAFSAVSGILMYYIPRHHAHRDSMRTLRWRKALAEGAGGRKNGG